MISRYTPKDYERLWSAENQYAVWYEVEMAAVAAMAEHGVVPKYAAAELEASGIDQRIDVARILEIEGTVRHDVIAFLTHMEELAGDHACWMHVGMTSSDLVDTGLAVILTEAVEGILSRMRNLISVASGMARRHAATLTIGRSHGMHAEPTTFGVFLSGHVQEFRRTQERLEGALSEIRYGKMSGAVGNYAHGSPAVESRTMELLGLSAEPQSTQVVPRDRHARLASVISLAGAAVERLATNLRHLSRSEVGDVREGFARGQKGSSAMPHKRNPIACENLCGCARLLRGFSSAVQEDVALWHERDISHSAVERVALADMTSLLAYMLERATSLLEGLYVDEARMESRVLDTSIWASEGVLLALVRSGVRRQEAYLWVQECAFQALDDHPSGKSFSERVLAHPSISAAVSPEVLRPCFDARHHVRFSLEIVGRSCHPPAGETLRGGEAVDIMNGSPRGEVL